MGVDEEVNDCRCIRSKKQEQRKATLSKQAKVTWRRTPGHSTSWTKHVSEAAPCFELQRSEAQRLVKSAVRGVGNSAVSDDECLPLHRSAENVKVLIRA